MNHDRLTAPGRNTRLENFAAELTSAVYALMLRRGLKGSWVWVELSLWKALTETVEKWARERPPVTSSGESVAWREGFLADLTDRATSVALKYGIEGPLIELEPGLYRAFRLAITRHRRVIGSE
jgi:hypothetical protein